MKDLLGNELEVGDKVVFHLKRGIVKAEVVSIHEHFPKECKIKYEYQCRKYQRSMYRYIRDEREILKIDSGKLIEAQQDRLVKMDQHIQELNDELHRVRFKLKIEREANSEIISGKEANDSLRTYLDTVYNTVRTGTAADPNLVDIQVVGISDGILHIKSSSAAAHGVTQINLERDDGEE